MMSKEERLPSELIADFMNWEFKTRNGKRIYNTPHIRMIREGCYSSGSFTALKMKFDSSWDWLIPVIREIRRLAHINSGETNYGTIYAELDMHYFDISRTFNSVIEFIKQHNKTK